MLNKHGAERQRRKIVDLHRPAVFVKYHTMILHTQAAKLIFIQEASFSLTVMIFYNFLYSAGHLELKPDIMNRYPISSME